MATAGKAGTRKPRRAFGPPPPSGAADGGWDVFLVPADLAAAAVAARLPFALSPDAAQAEADALNEALNGFVLWDQVSRRDAPASDKAEWCRHVAVRAAELQNGLGMPAPWAGASGQAFRDAMSHLARGKPQDDHLARSALIRAEEEAYNSALTGGGSPEAVPFWHAMERLRFTLSALARIADRAAEAWASEVRAGGRSPDDARLALFRDFGASYARMFGAPPTISTRAARRAAKRATEPGGPSLDWHRALLRLIRERALAPTVPVGGGPPVAPAERWPGAARLAELAEWAEGVRQGRETGSSDGLAALIRAARRPMRDRAGKAKADGVRRTAGE